MKQKLICTDVIDLLNFLYGKGMTSMYSWSNKRSYKNGFVWQDLLENNFVYPAHDQEYVLKGSELLENLFLKTAPPPTVNEGRRTISGYGTSPRVRWISTKKSTVHTKQSPLPEPPWMAPLKPTTTVAAEDPLEKQKRRVMNCKKKNRTGTRVERRLRSHHRHLIPVRKL
ncbi:protein UPSTREAM OF FLC [Abeliophyllum distichum]|uniref:Protein UPSTREAM OF FLC n=1 Tax=Abeliophyllum distichum TaxID=126358 RepID=A0ABD1TKE0_9LAMI